MEIRCKGCGVHIVTLVAGQKIRTGAVAYCPKCDRVMDMLIGAQDDKCRMPDFLKRIFDGR